ncbi:MAG: hypothetical protein LUD12_06975 [Lachnospiraceae bacterium]|nr:hypothetical protein [Lachnospiraceae bacterium]
MSATDESIKLIRKILNNSISEKDALKELDRLELMYGDEAFTAYDFQKKEKPWNEDYYEDLKNKCITGAGSKEFIIHLLEVREYLNQKKRNGRIFAGAAVLILVLIVICVIFVRR